MHFHQRWSPGIGDPTLIGWVTVAVYLLGAILCLWAARRSAVVEVYRSEDERDPKYFWLLVAMILIALGINKQLDLQTWLDQFGRDLAIRYGWYQSRDLIQAGFIASLAIFGILLTALTVHLLNKVNWTVKLAVFGCVLLFGFVLLRASAFQQFHVLFGYYIGGSKLNTALELGSLSVILTAAVCFIRLR